MNMKKLSYLLSVAAAAGAIAVCAISCNILSGEKKTESESVPAQKGDIVFYNLDRVLNEYQMAIDMRNTVQAEADEIQKDLERRQKKLERDITSFSSNIEKGLLTQAVAQEKGQKLQEQKNNLDQLAMAKSQEMAQKQQAILDKIAYAIKSYLEKYNEKKGYSMILSTQGDLLPAPVSLADESLDITDDIVEGLNDEYAKNQTATQPEENK